MHVWINCHDSLSLSHTHRQTKFKRRGGFGNAFLKSDKQSTKGEGNWYQSSVAPHPNKSSYANAHSHAHTLSQSHALSISFTHIRLSCGIQPTPPSLSLPLSLSFSLSLFLILVSFSLSLLGLLWCVCGRAYCWSKRERREGREGC